MTEARALGLGPVGLWTSYLDFQPAARVREVAAEIEGLGYTSLWVGENVGREPLVQAGLLLSATRRLVVATGIANIWARDPLTTFAAQCTLAEAYEGRFLLGLGVSHARLVETVRGHRYERPFSAMGQYLDAMDQAATVYRAVTPSSPPPRILAALGPRMLSLAAQRAQGAHTYLATSDHTAQARQVMGPGPWLVPEQAVVLESDRVRAREIARAHVGRYLPLPNYLSNLRRVGFTDDDFSDGGSDRLVDAVVAWGDEGAINRRVQEHLDAGADHVCLQVLVRDRTRLPIEEWQALAPAGRAAVSPAQSGPRPSPDADEAFKARMFPGIAFRDDHHERRPWLIGTALDVWQVVEGWRDVGSVERMVGETDLEEPQVRLALAYYERFREEIDQAIADNRQSLSALRSASPPAEVIEYDA